MVLRDAISRFMEKVYPCPTTGCWLWVANWDREGYPRFRHNRGMMGAHRFAWAEISGRLLPAWPMTIDHKCGVRCCVNPDHLQVLHTVENKRKGCGINGRMRLVRVTQKRTASPYCVRCGEPYHQSPNGNKACRACKKKYDRSRKERKP